MKHNELLLIFHCKMQKILSVKKSLTREQVYTYYRLCFFLSAAAACCCLFIHKISEWIYINFIHIQEIVNSILFKMIPLWCTRCHLLLPFYNLVKCFKMCLNLTSFLVSNLWKKFNVSYVLLTEPPVVSYLGLENVKELEK